MIITIRERKSIAYSSDSQTFLCQGSLGVDGQPQHAQTRLFGDDDVLIVSVYSPFHQPSVVVEICSSCDA